MQRGPDGEDHIRVGKLNLVDLAGSERQAKTGSTVRHYLHCVLCVYSCSTILPAPSPPNCRARGSRRQQESTSPSLLSAMSSQLWYSGWGLVQWVGPLTVGGAWYRGWSMIQCRAMLEQVLKQCQCPHSPGRSVCVYTVCTGGRQEQPHPLPRLKAHPTAARLVGGAVGGVYLQ